MINFFNSDVERVYFVKHGKFTHPADITYKFLNLNKVNEIN